MAYGDDSGQIKSYTTKRRIGDYDYCERICALTWAEAEELAAKIGATVVGVLKGQACEICGNIWIEEYFESNKDAPESLTVN